MAKRRSMFNNKRTAYNGLTYDSKGEAQYAQVLDVLMEAGEIVGWTRQVPFYLGVPENKYVTDFLVFRPDGTVYAIDVKGIETEKFKHNARLWARYGPCELLLVRDGRCYEVIIPGKGRITYDEYSLAQLVRPEAD